MAEEIDVTAELGDSPRGRRRWVRWLFGVGLLLILLSCAGINSGIYWIQTEQGREALAVLAIYNHGRCMAEAAEVKVGWRYDQLRDRLGDRLRQQAEDGWIAAPLIWPLRTLGDVQVKCRRPRSRTDSWCGSTTQFDYGLDVQGTVVSIDQSVSSWCE